MTSYALVNAGSNPLLMGNEDSRSSSSNDISADPRRELTLLYEHYAELYPNPRLVEEYRMKNELLQAASAAAHAKSSSTSVAKPSGGIGGLFGRLFGTSPPDHQLTQSASSNKNPWPDQDESQLDYIDQVNPNDDGSLCGTQQSLDTSCIPKEAMAVARFHLTSTRTRQEHPNTARWGPLSGKAVPTTISVVGLGVIAEFQPNQPSNLSFTSDRQDLLNYTTHSELEAFRLEYVRVCALSPNCVAISWGLQDGLVGFYRRVSTSPDSNTEGQGPVMGWERLWVIGPSPPVLEAIADVFHDDESFPGSPLLKVADLVPLRVSTGDPQRPMVATLALARVGGYIELLPLPTQLWFGPPLDPQKIPRQRRRPRGQHYAVGLSMGAPSLALTTTDYHLDITALDAIRTRVGPDSEWDQAKHPSAPPSEFIIVASGLSPHHKRHECLTFWSVSLLFPEEPLQQRDDMGFQLHSTLIEAIMVPSGAEVSLFATPEILQHWRMPRKVALKEQLPKNSSEDDQEDTTPSKRTKISTLSTAAPIVQLQFQGREHQQTAALAVLDWNGGTTVLGCGLLERAASQQLEPQEYAKQQWLKEADEVFPLVHTLSSRTELADAIQRQRIGNLHWLVGAANPGSSNLLEPILAPLVLLLRSQPMKLAVVTFEAVSTAAESESALDTPPPKVQPSVISLPFPAQGAAMGDLGSANLLFLSKRHVKDGTVLKFFVMQQLQPMAIVESLAREEKYEDAIHSAQKLDDLDQATLSDVIEECHRKLWETTRDVDSLADTRNGDYVVAETLAVCRSTNTYVSGQEMAFEKLRLLCQLALSMGRHTAPAESLKEISYYLVRVGTYELLCQHFGVPTYWVRFQQDFCQSSLEDIAKCLAQRGDCIGLSIIIFRHQTELCDGLLDILSNLPLEIVLDEWVHLVPVYRSSKIGDSFIPFVSGAGLSTTPLHWSQFPQHLQEKWGAQIVIDTADEKSVLEIHESSSKSASKLEQGAQWFLQRSRALQTILEGRRKPVIQLCEIGLLSLDIPVEDTSLASTLVSSHGSASVKGLYRTWKSALLLQSILGEPDEGNFDTTPQDEPIWALSISTDDLLTMDVAKLIDLVLQGEANPSQIQQRCTDYLQALLPALEDAGGTSGVTSVDEALRAYCVSLAQQAADCEDVVAIRKATVTVAAIISSSATSLHKRDRLIKDKKVLILVVLDVIQITSTVLEMVSCAENREILNAYWIMYEAMPDQLPQDMSGASAIKPLLGQADDLNQNLIAADILSRWPESHPFQVFVARTESSHFTREVGEDVLLSLCKSFLASLSMLQGLEKGKLLLQDLLSDIASLNDSCCGRSLDLPTLLCNHLVQPLLPLEYFSLVVVFLEGDSQFVDREQVKKVLLSFVDEAVFAESENKTNQVMSAMKCQDIIGPSFPEIQPGFVSIRRYLDAAHFISTVIYEGKDLQARRPADLKKHLPVDLVESIINEVPESIFCGCPQWQDEAFAHDANAHLRGALDKTLPHEVVAESESPVLPGGAVFHLAIIVGLDSKTAALVVKCRVIHHAMEAGIYGAAAAICRTLVRDEDEPESETTAIMAAKLGAVACVVANTAYTDLLTKRELCCAAIARYSGTLNVALHNMYDQICAVSMQLELLMSRHSREHPWSPDRHRQLMSRPSARLQQHIQTEYNADVHGLFHDLAMQTSDGVVHDSLMNALSRFIIYWCVSDSKQLRTQLVMSEKSDTCEKVALGCSFILHIPSRLTAGNCVHELQKVAADQAAIVSTEDRFSGASDDICTPDDALVSRLVGRGYPANAARRAVVMTGNAGYNEALGWAVTHTLDPDFNSPILILRDPKKKWVDELAIQLLRKSLYNTQVYLDDTQALDNLLSFLASMHGTRRAGTEEISVTSETMARPKEKVASAPPAPSRIDQSIAPTLPRAPPTPPARPRSMVASSPQPPRAPPTPPPGTSQTISTRSPQMRTVPRTPPRTTNADTASKGATVPKLPLASSAPQTPPPPLRLPHSGDAPNPVNQKQKMLPTISSVHQSTPQGRSQPPVSNGKALPVAPRAIVNGTPSRKRDTLPPSSLSSPAVKTTRTPIRTPGSTSRTDLLKRGQEQLARLRSSGKAPAKTSTGLASVRNKLPPSASGIGAKRIDFLKRGQDALTKIRNNGSPSNRKKLIEEGRQLLRKNATERTTPRKLESEGSTHAMTTRSATRRVSPAPGKLPAAAATKGDDDTASEASGWDFDNFDDM